MSGRERGDKSSAHSGFAGYPDVSETSARRHGSAAPRRARCTVFRPASWGVAADLEE